jgi:hypothetical protein
MRQELLDAIESDLVQATVRSFQDKANLWIGTPYEFYFTLHNTQQGKIGECFVDSFMTKRGSVVSGRQKGAGHDKTIDGMRVEIKFSLQKSKLYDFVFNHISVGKDWERIIFCGLNVDDSSVFVWCNKDDFASYIARNGNTGSFKGAQGGNSMNNDDYIISGPPNVKKFLSLPFIKHIDEWSKPPRGIELFL